MGHRFDRTRRGPGPGRERGQRWRRQGSHRSSRPPRRRLGQEERGGRRHEDLGEEVQAQEVSEEGAVASTSDPNHRRSYDKEGPGQEGPGQEGRRPRRSRPRRSRPRSPGPRTSPGVFGRPAWRRRAARGRLAAPVTSTSSRDATPHAGKKPGTSLIARRMSSTPFLREVAPRPSLASRRPGRCATIGEGTLPLPSG